ncbi:UDP-N-acetylmuramate-L-alanine ligase [Neisseria meningitidis M01-240013]|nr:UDP-N-acetylmuramate-L-alanine ligase [Neisseria meningitidis M01-240013]
MFFISIRYIFVRKLWCANGQPFKITPLRIENPPERNIMMKNRVTNIHFVGIGGVGMSGIAEVLHNLGFKVSGSDQARNAATEHLGSLGIQVYPGHTAEHVNGADVVVTSTAVKKENPEVVAALEQQIPVIPRALMLAELMRFRDGIAIAGTHGKTTTTSLTASILGAAGLDPTFVIGGKLNAAGTNARLGKGEYIVAEADESDASFLHLTPIMSVVTNIDEDHMDTYGHSVEKLHQAFVDFIHRMPFYGKAFLCIDSEHVRAILPKVSKPYATYGLDDTADIYATDIENVGAQMKFTVHVQMKGHEQGSFEVVLNMPGRHNVLNALAAIGVALEVGASVEAIQKGLLGFEGVGRRFQKYGDIKLPNGGTALLVDDYGHHPVEMAATLSAARGAYLEKRLVLAFQPHRYTRTRDLFEDFTKVLNTVDALVLTEVYAAGEEPIAAADSRALARAIRVLGKLEPIYCENVADLPEMLLNVLQDGDIVLNMGAGSINRVPAALLALSKQI